MRAKTCVLTVVVICLAGTAFADGFWERARSIFFNEVQRSYGELKTRMDAGKTDEAKESCKQLHEATNKLYEEVSKTKRAVETLGDTPVKKAWEDVEYSTRNLNVAVGSLESTIGKGNAQTQFSELSKSLDSSTDAMKKAENVFIDFGRRWQEICDTCK